MSTSVVSVARSNRSVGASSTVSRHTKASAMREVAQQPPQRKVDPSAYLNSTDPKLKRWDDAPIEEAMAYVKMSHVSWGSALTASMLPFAPRGGDSETSSKASRSTRGVANSVRTAPTGRPPPQSSTAPTSVVSSSPRPVVAVGPRRVITGSMSARTSGGASGGPALTAGVSASTRARINQFVDEVRAAAASPHPTSAGPTVGRRPDAGAMELAVTPARSSSTTRRGSASGSMGGVRVRQPSSSSRVANATSASTSAPDMMLVGGGLSLTGSGIQSMNSAGGGSGVAGAPCGPSGALRRRKT
eukprot:PhM_4_TR12486/c0_g1_i1/m.81870